MFALARADIALDRAATLDAIAPAREFPHDDDARGRAELQITRLDSQAGRLDDLARDIIDMIANVDPSQEAEVRAFAAAVDVARADLAHTVQATRAALAR